MGNSVGKWPAVEGDGQRGMVTSGPEPAGRGLTMSKLGMESR